jgi:hypothetical protein
MTASIGQSSGRKPWAVPVANQDSDEASCAPSTPMHWRAPSPKVRGTDNRAVDSVSATSIHCCPNERPGRMSARVEAMIDANTSLLMNEVARDILADIAPQELPIFPAVSKAYFADPAIALNKLRSRDTALGLGIESLAILLTPIVLHILTEAFQILMEAAKKAVTDGLAKEIPDAMKMMLKRFRGSGPSVPPPAGKLQLDAIRAKIQLTAKEMQLPDDKIEALLNAVAAQLVIAD